VDKPSVRRSKLKILILAATATILGAFAAVWSIAGLLTEPAPQTIGSLPSDLAGRSVQFQSTSGSTIHGWFVPGKPGTGAVALMHGVRSNRLSMLERARFLSHAGYTVLLFDFQAHGESAGKHITFGSLESKDAQAAIHFLHENVPGEKVGVIGVSLGGAAVALSSPPLSVDAAVLEMVYPTIDEATDNRITMRLGRWSQVLVPLLLLQLPPRLGISRNDLRPIDHVGKMPFPKLFIAGANDKHTTLEESNRLYETASKPKEFWVIQNAAHEDLHNASRVEYEQRILEFFRKYLR
jgi:fermentation-respiration switch protein FrsA (DUF1100 family)